MSIFSFSAYAQNVTKKDTTSIVKPIDSVKFEPDSLKVSAIDSTKVDSITRPKEFLDDQIKKKSKDYISNNFFTKKATLYNEAQINYQDIELRAGIIIIDYDKNLAFAKGIKDSTGAYIQRPYFKQGEQESEQDSLIYNFRNEKAVIYNTKTEQTGVIIRGEITKRENDSTVYINKAMFTTSEKEKPDYHIATNNIKVVPGKKIVGGLSQLYLANVPTPAILPFFYAPLSRERSVSGIILPTWGQTSNQGFFLQNGGYYFAISDYVDLALQGDVYTNGSYGLRAESNYVKRYKYSGNFSFRYENLITGQRGFEGSGKRKNYNVVWRHSQDAASNPNSRFSANVNFGSGQYFRQSLNEINISQQITNNFNSSINYYKKFVGTPFNMNLNASHSQNTNTSSVNLVLPSLQVTMDRIYPFAPKSGAKKNALQSIGVNYNMDLRNTMNTTEDEFFTSKMFREARNGIQHTVSANTNMKALKYVTISPNVNYREVWYLKTINQRFDPNLTDGNQVVTDTIDGFSTFREYSGSVSASTNIYGMFNFKKGRLKAIRHTIRPSVSFNYNPGFGHYYDRVQDNDNPIEYEEYTRFKNGVFGSPTKNRSGSVGFSVNNVFEAKVMPKDSTETEAKKITLLNNLNFSTSYDIARDSVRWAPLRMTGATSFFNNKLSLNFNATLNPYALNANNVVFDEWNINNGGSLFRLTNAGIAASYSISSTDLGKKNKTTPNQNNSTPDSQDLLGGNLTTRNSKFDKSSEGESKTKKATLYKSLIPWNLSFRYSMTYSNSARQNEISNNSLQFSGSVELSPKWNVGISSGYDFKRKGITPTSLNFERDLDSWRMSFNWIPFGISTSHYFFIGVKSSVLSDLKYDQRKVPDRRLF